ncbi:MAG TPA: hypothetical protein VGO56_14120 [Pyrinomonadaceae bacterium]|jgi:tetratricopeptide (TPR) repeat protein|nr:hypothetical protein [Pyrinomonadaceae bacterium]
MDTEHKALQPDESKNEITADKSIIEETISSSPRRSPIKKVTKKTIIKITAVATFLALILGVMGKAFDLWDRLFGKRSDESICRNIYETARDYARKGDFEFSSKILNGQVDIYSGVKVLERCEQNNDVNLLRHEVELLGIASKDYQFKVRDTNQRKDSSNGDQGGSSPPETMDDTLKRIESGLGVIDKLAGPHKPAELYVLAGIVDDLHDLPFEAVKKFQKAIETDEKNAVAHNMYGLVVRKWRIGYASWADDAIKQFDDATKAQKDFVRAPINKASIFLTQVQDELNKDEPYFVEDTDGAPPNLARADAWLNSAQASLQLADKIIETKTATGDESAALQDSPSRHIMWARYYLLRGQIYRRRGLDPLPAFYQAEGHLKTVKKETSSFVEASLLLGITYEELGLDREKSNEKFEDALREFQGAFAADNSNLEACMKLAYRLLFSPTDKKRNEEAARVISEGLELDRKFRDNINTRLSKIEPANDCALNWLHKRLKEADLWENNFKAMQTHLGRQH